MPGNSSRRGAVRGRQSGNPTAGSGGRRRRGLQGKGPTPKAADRPQHKAHTQAKRAAASAGRRDGSGPAGSSGSRRHDGGGPDWVVGRNPVVEALRAGVPVTTVYVAERISRDDRVREVLTVATQRGLPLLEAPRGELDRLTGGANHQGLALQVPPYSYAHPDDLLARAHQAGEPALIVACDGVTDPRNLGAIVRSAAAFGAHGVLIPERRSAGMTASAQKAAAGAASRLPVAHATNLVRALTGYADAGLRVVGLAADGSRSIAEVAADLAADGMGVVIVVGSEGKGLRRLVGQTCDEIAGIPMSADTESLNASVAASLACYELARARVG